MKTLRVKAIFVLTLAVFFLSCAGGAGFVGFSSASEGEGFQITGVDAQKTENGFLVSIMGNSPPTFTVYELFDPLRIVIDIANASLGSVQLPMEVNQGPVASLSGKVLAEKEPVIVKLEIFLTEDREYSVNREENTIQVAFRAEKGSLAEAAAGAASDKSDVGTDVKEIYNVKIDTDGEATTVLLVAGQPIENYRHAELPAGSGRPDRIYVDIDGATAPTIQPIQEVGKGALARVRTAIREGGVRIVFDSSLNRLFGYDIMAVSDGLKVTIRESSAADREARGDDPVGAMLGSVSTDGSMREENGSDQVTAAEGEGAVTEQLKKVGVAKDMYSSLGYDKQKISVDFYKTNLHNVFRLIGEISGQNVVVDDGVSGSLTLSLDAVPWDFILDVITNLKGLQKEERYNTIVISPQSKGFIWPEPKIVAKDTDLQAPPPELEMTLDQQLSQAPEVTEAKMKIQRANTLRQEGNIRGAIALYEQALEQYTDEQESAELAKLIAGMYLADLGINIKAVDYAKKALALNPEDQEASLMAAIGYANMGQSQAREYFEMATAGDHPTRDSLINYAAYAEDMGTYESALSNLKRYEEIYDHTLEIMVSKARIYDGMGRASDAVAEYQLILNSGYEVDPDLAQYIKARIALDKQ